MRKSMAEIVREYGPFPRANNVGGVTYDGRSVWFAAGDAVRAFDPATGEEQDAIDVPAHAGTAFDGEFLYQIAEQRIQKIDPRTRRVVSTIPAPGAGGDSGLAWAEGRCGSANTARARFIRWTRTRARSFAPSSRTGSSPE